MTCESSRRGLARLAIVVREQVDKLGLGDAVRVLIVRKRLANRNGVKRLELRNSRGLKFLMGFVTFPQTLLDR